MIKKVLIIDDNIIFCNALKYHLLDREYDVEVCFSFNELRERIDLRNFDLILLDAKLKDIEGFDLLQKILGQHPDKKVIIISSYLDDKNIMKAKKLGAIECIHKSSDFFEDIDTIIHNI